MSNRSAADAFGKVFRILAKHVGKAPGVILAVAKEVYEATDKIDFHPMQMECDSELVTLGLIKACPSHPDRLLFRPGETCDECFEEELHGNDPR